MHRSLHASETSRLDGGAWLGPAAGGSLPRSGSTTEGRNSNLQRPNAWAVAGKCVEPNFFRLFLPAVFPRPFDKSTRVRTFRLCTFDSKHSRSGGRFRDSMSMSIKVTLASFPASHHYVSNAP